MSPERALRRRFAALALASLAALSPGEARAQACCSGVGVATPARLAMHEDALVAAQVRAAIATGSYGSDGAYRAFASGSSEQDVETSLVGALRFASKGQASALVPWVETRRTSGVAKESSGGVGDVTLALRWDFVLARETFHGPGVAVIGGAKLPTGRAIEDATKPLATDATGAGALEGSLGVAVEQIVGAFLVGGQLVAKGRAPRSVRGVRTEPGPGVAATLSAAFAPGDLAVGGFVSWSADAPTTIDGARDDASARRLTTLGLSAALDLGGFWRAQTSLAVTPPASSWGKNQSATESWTLFVARAF